MANRRGVASSFQPSGARVDDIGMDAREVTESGLGSSSPRLRIVAAVAAALTLVWAAAVVVPQWRLERLNCNETMAISRLKWISNAEEHMKAVRAWDPGATDVGGFGFFSDLRGEPSRSTAVLQWGSHPPPLPGDFVVEERGQVHRNGYVFALFLPAKDGGWATERDAANGRAIDEAKARELWICYAWPERAGSTGRRVFMIHQSGDLVAHGNGDLKFGGDALPTPGASGFVLNEQGARIVVNAIDCLGDLWWIVG